MTREEELEDELMDMAYNERSYMPLKATRLERATSVPAQRLRNAFHLEIKGHEALSIDEGKCLRTRAASTGTSSTSSSAFIDVDKQEDPWLEHRREIVQKMIQERQNKIRNRLEEIEADRSTQARSVDEMDVRFNGIIDATEVESQSAENAEYWHQLVDCWLPTERDDLAKAADDSLLNQLKYQHSEKENEERIRTHLHTLWGLQVPKRHGRHLRPMMMTHSLTAIMEDFISIFTNCYEEFAISTSKTSLSDDNDRCSVCSDYAPNVLAAVVPMLASDVLFFTSILKQLVVHKYDVLQGYKECIEKIVSEALFELLQPTLHTVFINTFAEEDLYVSHLSASLEKAPPSRFKIAEKYRLDGSALESTTGKSDREKRKQSLRQYRKLIESMDSLGKYRSPWLKWDILARICHDIDSIVQDYYAKTTPGTKRRARATSDVTADDLCALLAFFIASSTSTRQHVYSHLAILGCFMPSRLSHGERGFALATTTTAAKHLIRLQLSD